MSDSLAPSSTTASPTNASINYLSIQLASLDPIFKLILENPLKKTIRLLPKIAHHERLLSDMTSNEKKVPSSCRFKFTLAGSDLISTTTEFKEMALEANEIVMKSQLALKDIVIKSQQLELSQTRLEILHSLVDTVVQYCKAKAVWDGFTTPTNNNPIIAKIAIKCLSTEALHSRLEISSDMILTDVRERVFTLTDETDLDIPETFQSLFQDVEKVFDNVIVGSISQFFIQQNINFRLERMEALIQEASLEKATAETAIAMESEDLPDPKTIQRLINDAVSKKTKSLNDQIKSLKNKSRGAPATVSAPSTNQNDPAQADARDNASSSAPTASNSTPPATNKPIRKQRRRSTKKVSFSNAATK